MSSAALFPTTDRIPALLNPGARNAADARALLARDPRFALLEVGTGQLQPLVRRAIESRAPVVLVAGGDGTLRQAAEVLRGTGTSLGVLPAGTRNHFARDFGIPLDLAGALDLAAAGHVHTVDLGTVNGHTILNTSSVGAYVSYVRLRRRLDRWLGYLAASLAAGLISLRRHRRFAVRVQLDGKHLDYRAVLVFVGIGERSLDRPAPGSRRPGGARVLHVFVLHESSRLRMAALAARVLARGIPYIGDEDGVHAFQVESCIVEPTWREGHAAIDGELLALRAPLRYTLDRDALRVVMGQASRLAT